MACCASLRSGRAQRGMASCPIRRGHLRNFFKIPVRRSSETPMKERRSTSWAVAAIGLAAGCTAGLGLAFLGVVKPPEALAESGPARSESTRAIGAIGGAPDAAIVGDG